MIFSGRVRDPHGCLKIWDRICGIRVHEALLFVSAGLNQTMTVNKPQPEETYEGFRLRLWSAGFAFFLLFF